MCVLLLFNFYYSGLICLRYNTIFLLLKFVYSKFNIQNLNFVLVDRNSKILPGFTENRSFFVCLFNNECWTNYWKPSIIFWRKFWSISFYLWYLTKIVFVDVMQTCKISSRQFLILYSIWQLKTLSRWKYIIVEK